MRLPDQLVAALRTVAERDDAVSREAMYTALLDSSLFLPAEPGDDTRGAHRRAAPVHHPAGRRRLLEAAGLHRSDAAGAWRSEGVQFVERAAREVFAFAVGSPTSGILLNVAGPAGGELTRREFAALAEGVLPAAEPDDVEELELAPGAEVLVAPLQTRRARPSSVC